jgi:hypothetical protein
LEQQRLLDRAYAALASGEISRQSYFRQINALADDPEIAGRFRYRKDQRSLGHFALTLYDNTLRERFLLDAAWPYISREGDRAVDLGVNNDGRLVLRPDGKNRNLDFLVRNEALGDYPLEVKYCPTQRFLTYKIDDLSNYLDTPDARVLTVAVANGMVGSNGNPDRDVAFALPPYSFFTLMDHEAIRRLIQTGESGNHAGFGGKPTVRIYQRQFHKAFTINAFEKDHARAR